MQLSHSDLKNYTTCKRKWYLGTYLEYGIRPERKNPVGKAQMGTRIHLCMEACYGYDLNPLDVLNWQYEQELASSPEFESELLKEKRLATAVVEGYFEWAGEEAFDYDMEVVATEQQVNYPIETPNGSFDLIAKLDMIIKREEDGATLFRDWKTVDTLTKADSVVRDTQMRTYAMLRALTSEGVRVDGGQYVMLKRSARTVRARPPFYGVAEVRYNRHDLNSTFQRTQAIGGEILATKQALDEGGSHNSLCYTSPGDHCSWACIFKDVCPMFDDGSRATDALAGEFVKTDPHARYTDDAMQQALAALGPKTSPSDPAVHQPPM